MKLVCLCSALDMKYRLGCTPAWWQFLKGLHELGHEVIAVPYHGAAFETPWWRAYKNPCYVEGQAFAALKKMAGGGASSTRDGVSGSLKRLLIEHWVRPQWERHLSKILETERGVDAVLVFNVPANHLAGVPGRLRTRYGVRFFFYDGDVPASLPRFGGFSSGFRIYDGADLAEYDGVMCNSEGGLDDLKQLGAHTLRTVHWGVDPELYAPLDLPPDRDVFFYGYGSEYRELWMQDMVAAPSREMPQKTFVVGGTGFAVDLGQAVKIGIVPFNAIRAECCRSRINLNITRQAHGTVYASSTLRPFELAAMGCCVVSGRYEGLETWFDIGNEMLRVESADEAVDTYRRLLDDEDERRRIGHAARERVLADHTHRHRAGEIVDFIESTKA